MTDVDAWYWCLRHHRPERRGECRAEDRLGPYPTQEDAQRWSERRDAREERWEAEDERWERAGLDDDEDA